MSQDPLVKLKYIGYCTSQLPPEGVDKTYEDHLHYFKFYLCNKRNVLMLDPVWDRYSNEQIIIEYFATIYAENKEAREQFELQLLSLNPEQANIYDWFDAEIEKNKIALANKYQEDLSFEPEVMGV